MSKQFNGSCFGHVLLKMCQCATIDEKAFHGLNYASNPIFKNALHGPKNQAHGSKSGIKLALNLG